MDFLAGPGQPVVETVGLGKEGLSRYTGAVAAIEGWVTGVIPAFLLLSGRWVVYDRTAAIVLVVISVVAFGALYPKLTGPVQAPRGPSDAAVPSPG